MYTPPRCDLGFATTIVDPTVGAAGAAALCAALTHWLGRPPARSPEGEVASEVVGWALLAVLLNTKRWRRCAAEGTGVGDDGSGEGLLGLSGGVASKGGKGWAVWAVAAGVAGACCYRAEVGSVGLFPVLTPLLLVADRKLRPESWSGRSEKGFFSPLANTVWGTALVALVAVFAQSEWDIGMLSLSVIPVAAFLVAYTALIPRTDEGHRFLPQLDIEEDGVPLSLRVTVLLFTVLGVQTLAFGLPSINFVTTTLLMGLTKAFCWYFTIQTAQKTAWCIAAAIGTFGIVASRDPYIQLSEIQAMAPVVASSLVLIQIFNMLPRQAKGKALMWALVLLPLSPYIANTISIRTEQASALHNLEHPIEILVRDAKADFERLLEGQSKTYPAAVDEYRRRYKVDPPPGFDAWYEYAVANQSPLIDEFDTIYHSVSPFWKLSGKDVVQMMNDANKTSGIDLWLCTLNGSTAETHCNHPKRSFDRHISDLFNKLLGDLAGVLPNMTFLANHLDEPRVLIPPPDSAQYHNFTLTSLSERPTWNAITAFCPPTHSQPPQHLESPLPLVMNLTNHLSLCANPSYAHIHGLFLSPPSFSLITGPVPVLSPGSTSTMSDILFPAPAYLTEHEFQYNPSHDIPWHDKADYLYWVGSTTGGVASTTSDWQSFHRQRFIALAQNLNLQSNNRQQHTYLHEADGQAHTSRSSFLNGRLYNVHPARIFQCAHPRACRAQRSLFRRVPWQDADAAFRAKLVFDLDGNGISGRFYKLLASGSVVLKMTVLREWHDDRLRPWVHYVPVSVGMGEVPEVVRWFLETRRGREVAREVAEGGREWFGRGMREVDVKIYLWRLVLELARVGDVRRGVLA